MLYCQNAFLFFGIRRTYLIRLRFIHGLIQCNRLLLQENVQFHLVNNNVFNRRSRITHLGLLSRKSLWVHFIKTSYCVDRFLSTLFVFIKHNSLISQILSFFFCGNCVLNFSFFPCIMIMNPRSEDRGHKSEDLSVAKSPRNFT